MERIRVVYTPRYSNGSNGSVYCREGETYSDVVKPDDVMLTPDYTTTVAGASGDRANNLIRTWANSGFYNRLCEFAAAAHKAFTEGFGVEIGRKALFRLDVVAFFPKKHRDGDFFCVLDTAKPLLLLNEVDCVGCASLYVDFFDPGRDDLACGTSRMQHRVDPDVSFQKRKPYSEACIWRGGSPGGGRLSKK
ncbi:hypothetical protein KFL_010700020 [Klebsormidium nitens]|uniref:Uncharacterized protein n=1 Tax=Klebsormidium nitens TaxID=105231 RepID=A0A1Y1IP09_KLENI|nr:hypothetical protein KFL_010700020 [Klebsormidium nitens]|eukprot:GAQ92610.1 hypothetical protein KFL_010700020 [Klebsormidium nitens]